MTQSWLCLSLVVVCLGCVTTRPTVGVPNLSMVHPGLWRSGQPGTKVDWLTLQRLGIETVVKLNFSKEGSDAAARILGMTLYELPIQPNSREPWRVLERPDRAAIFQALGVMMGHQNVLVHCTHGADRTGLVIGMYRVLHDGWSKQDAYAEMLEHGFHPELLGLQQFWEDFRR